jgi:hypothetical protein
MRVASTHGGFAAVLSKRSALFSLFVVLTAAGCGSGDDPDADADADADGDADGDADADADADGDGDADGDADADADVCQPDCDDRVCGDDGCGGSCGSCDPDESCTGDGECQPAGDGGCGAQPSLPECGDDVLPAPEDSPGIVDHSEANAIPLRCDEGGEQVWELDVLVDEFDGMLIFMMGEAHGSNEIGPASVALFEALYDAGSVDVVALEIGMDATESMAEYIETGGGDFATLYGSAALGTNMFRRVFPERARERFLADGTIIDLRGVDTPQRLAWVNEQLLALAETIADDAARGLVVDPMPPPREMDEYGLLGLPTAYVTQCQTYYEAIVADLDAICAELPAGDETACDRLEHLAYALWIGAIFNSQDFMLEMLTGGSSPQMLEWMDQREDLIYWNYEQLWSDVGAGVYAHMGSAHVAKGGTMRHVAAMLNELHSPTLGAVYSVTPAYGPGSRIFYGFMTQDVPAEPSLVAEALAEAPVDNYYLSTVRPGFDCTASPWTDVPSGMGLPGTTYGDWDAFFWYRVLTPDVPDMGGGGGGVRSLLTAGERALLDHVERIRFADEVMARWEEAR